MWRNGDSLVNNTDQNKFSISLIIIGLIWIGSLYFIPFFEAASSTYYRTTVIMNNETNDANFDKIQTNTSEMLYDIYYPIEVGNLILPILISSDRNSVSNLFFDNEEESIIIVTDSLNTASGKLLIDIPRNILDSKANGNDKNFTVMVDDVPAKFLEVTNSSEEKMFSNSIINNGSAIQYSNNTESRILMIEFDSSSKIIKINGTDTNYSDKGFQANSTRTNQTYSDSESQYNNFIPITAVIVVLGVVVFYFLYRKNKLRYIKKFRS